MDRLFKTAGAYQLLKNEGKAGGFSHAYLLLFEDGRFLRDALKAFAKLLFDCDEPITPEKKRVAQLIDEESFSDCVFTPAAGKKPMVEDAEKILEESTLSPVEGDKKVFVVGDFAEANAQTQNKLLKLLEEPPKGVIFLLGATSAFPVLPTVLSRAKKLEILPFSVPAVTEFLHRKYGDEYEEESLKLCAATTNGNIGDACALLEGGYQKTLTEAAVSLLLSPSYKLPQNCKTVGDTPYKKELLNLLRLLLRDALLIKTGLKGHILLPSEAYSSTAIAEKLSTPALLYGQEALSEAEKQVKFNAVFSQCLELCIANILSKNKT